MYVSDKFILMIYCIEIMTKNYEIICGKYIPFITLKDIRTLLIYTWIH